LATSLTNLEKGKIIDLKGENSFDRSVGLVVSLYVSALVFVILAIFGSGATVSFFAIILFFAGIFIGGPQVIVGSVVSSDLVRSSSPQMSCSNLKLGREK